MGILEKIAEIEREIARTQKNKGDLDFFIGLLTGSKPVAQTSIHFRRLVTDSATTFPQSTFEGRTR